MKKPLIAGAIAVGLVAAIWQIVAQIYQSTLADVFPLTGLAVSGFFGWTTLYAMGGKKALFLQGIATNFSGVFWGIVLVLILMIFPTEGVGFYVGLAVAGFISAGMMVFQAHIKLLYFVPAAFIGCTTFFAVGGNISMEVIATSLLGLLLGNLLGVLSTSLSKFLETKQKKN